MILLKKIQYKLRNLLAKLFFIRLDWGSIFWTLFFLLIIVILGINIFTAFSKGVDTIESFKKEQQKLLNLQKEHDNLQKQVDMYQSIEYKKMYARENLNLADKNESLYYIDRPEEEVAIEGLPEPKMEITLADNFSYWRKLILGL